VLGSFAGIPAAERDAPSITHYTRVARRDCSDGFPCRPSHGCRLHWASAFVGYSCIHSSGTGLVVFGRIGKDSAGIELDFGASGIVGGGTGGGRSALRRNQYSAGHKLLGLRRTHLRTSNRRSSDTAF
jgi:hypothetical protein